MRNVSAIPLPQSAQGESFYEYELPAARDLARRLRAYLNRRVVLYGGGSCYAWPCTLRRVSVSVTHRCVRDEQGHVVRDPKRPEKRDWIPDPSKPKVATVTVHLTGRDLPTKHPFVGSWNLKVPETTVTT